MQGALTGWKLRIEQPNQVIRKGREQTPENRQSVYYPVAGLEQALET